MKQILILRNELIYGRIVINCERLRLRLQQMKKKNDEDENKCNDKNKWYKWSNIILIIRRDLKLFA